MSWFYFYDGIIDFVKNFFLVLQIVIQSISLIPLSPCGMAGGNLFELFSFASGYTSKPPSRINLRRR